MILLNIFLVLFVIVYLVDVGYLPTYINKVVFRVIYGRSIKYNGFSIPIISCSKCLSFWVVLVYSLANGIDVIIALFLASLMSLLSIVLGKFINKVLDLINDRLL